MKFSLQEKYKICIKKALRIFFRVFLTPQETQVGTVAGNTAYPRDLEFKGSEAKDS